MRRPNQKRVAIVGLLIAVVSFSSVAATASGEASTSEVGEVAWSQLGDDIDGDANSPGFGHSVAVSDDGTRVVIGSSAYEPGNDELSYVQVHEWDGSAWQQLGTDISVTTTGFNAFGFSVAISGDGNRVAVGDPYGPDGFDIGGVGVAETGPDDYPPGTVQVFDWDGSTWQQVGEPIEGTGAVTEGFPEFFGWSVALSSDGERVVAGSTLQARAFDYDSVNGWTQTGNAIGSTDQANGAVAISADGNRVAVGPGLLPNVAMSGGEFVLQIFDYDVSDGWIQVGSDFDGEDIPGLVGSEFAVGDIPGSSVAMSADGNRVVFTSIDISAESSSVRVMDYIDGDWNQVGDTISGTETSGDASFGYSLAISADGTRIAITAYSGLGGNVSETSYLQVGEWNGSAWRYDVELAPGLTLAMSADGNLIASGNVFFFENPEQSPVLVYALPASVSFDAGDGENAPVDMSGDRGSDATLPTSEPTRTGYTFLGWNTASDGSGTSYAAGDTYTLPASEGDTLYAQWQPISTTTTTTTTTVPVEVTPPAAEPAEPVSDTPTFTG